MCRQPLQQSRVEEHEFVDRAAESRERGLRRTALRAACGRRKKVKAPVPSTTTAP
jgi:hypothetical protein